MEFVLDPSMHVRIFRTFVELVPAEVHVPRTQSSPALLSALQNKASAEPKAVSMQLPEEVPGDEVHDQYGYHADHPAWQDVKKIMIRNLPARASYEELACYLQTLTSSAFHLSLPLNGSGRNCGYAFVTLENPHSLRVLVQALWQQRIPSRSGLGKTGLNNQPLVAFEGNPKGGYLSRI